MDRPIDPLLGRLVILGMIVVWAAVLFVRVRLRQRGYAEEDRLEALRANRLH
jgi:hypothetical protein